MAVTSLALSSEELVVLDAAIDRMRVLAEAPAYGRRQRAEFNELRDLVDGIIHEHQP